jgi:hypothetical protein
LALAEKEQRMQHKKEIKLSAKIDALGERIKTGMKKGPEATRNAIKLKNPMGTMRPHVSGSFGATYILVFPITTTMRSLSLLRGIGCTSRYV